jgi:hypothetical protein
VVAQAQRWFFLPFYSLTTPGAFRIAAALVSAAAKPSSLASTTPEGATATPKI